MIRTKTIAATRLPREQVGFGPTDTLGLLVVAGNAGIIGGAVMSPIDKDKPQRHVELLDAWMVDDAKVPHWQVLLSSGDVQTICTGADIVSAVRATIDRVGQAGIAAIQTSNARRAGVLDAVTAMTSSMQAVSLKLAEEDSHG